MINPHKVLTIVGLLAVSFGNLAYAANGANGTDAEDHAKLKQAPMPHQRSSLPPTAEQKKFNLPPTKATRADLGLGKNKNQKAMIAPPPSADCTNMTTLGTYSGDALADYIVNLPSYDCHYGLFSLNASDAANIYSPANFNAVVNRFTQEAAKYNASNLAVVNPLTYLRSGY